MTKEIQLSWTFCTWLRGVLSKYDDESLLLFALVSICCLCLLLSFSDSNGPSEWKIVERTNDTLFLTLFLLFLSILARKIRRAYFRDFYASSYLYVCAQKPHKITHFHKDNVTWKNSQKWLDGIYERFSSILTLCNFKHCARFSLGSFHIFLDMHRQPKSSAVHVLYSRIVYEKGRFGWMLKHLAATAHFHKRVRASLFPTRLHAPYRQHRPYDAIERSLISLGLK